jgi:hypothetical protein
VDGALQSWRNTKAVRKGTSTTLMFTDFSDIVISAQAGI